VAGSFSFGSFSFGRAKENEHPNLHHPFVMPCFDTASRDVLQHNLITGVHLDSRFRGNDKDGTGMSDKPDTFASLSHTMGAHSGGIRNDNFLNRDLSVNYLSKKVTKEIFSKP